MAEYVLENFVSVWVQSNLTFKYVINNNEIDFGVQYNLLESFPNPVNKGPGSCQNQLSSSSHIKFCNFTNIIKCCIVLLGYYFI